MEDLYEKVNAYSSASTVAQPLPCATDEMSVFLQQILVRSSSSSAAGVFGSDGISAVDSSTAYLSRNTGREIGHNVSSSSLEPSGNDNDDYDWESEEGLEALVEEMSTKSANPRGSTKRSRAAEVHNLSEKRRRSRINEKMKALQNLIPNSNKTDKASMLDEAIEYLKQLQLQVQMLAMRNGLSLYPVTLPGGSHPAAHISRTRIEFGDENRSLHQIPTPQQTTSAPNLSSLPNQSASSNQQLLSNIINIVSSETTVGLEPPIQTRHGTFQHQPLAHDICNENGLINSQRNGSNSETSHLGFGVDTIAIPEGDWSEDLLLTAIEQSLLLPSQVNSMRTERNASREDFRVDRTKL